MLWSSAGAMKKEIYYYCKLSTQSECYKSLAFPKVTRSRLTFLCDQLPATRKINANGFQQFNTFY